MKTIPLTRGYVALVDDDDYPALIAMGAWQVLVTRDEKVYASCRGRVSMHRLILRAPTGVEVDHHNGNTLDNRRSNLRLATDLENSRNKAKPRRRNASSIWKGVERVRGSGTWRATINLPVRTHLGFFRSEQEAARAYDHAAARFFGEFARLNFPYLLHLPPPVSRRGSKTRALNKRPTRTGYKGVAPTTSGRFTARIGANGQSYSLGSYDTPEEAARAYNQAASKLHGRTAVLNQLPD